MPSSCRILLVYGERLIQLCLRCALIDDGHTIELASTVDEAVAMLDRNVYDVLYSGLSLSGGSGLEVIRHASNCPSPPHCALLTSLPDHPDVLQAVEEGAEIILEDPAAITDLVEATARITGDAT